MVPEPRADRRGQVLREGSSWLCLLWPHALLAVVVTAVVFWRARGGTWPRSHEGVRYLVLGEHFRDAFVAGAPYPRWLPRLDGGHGYPTFVFYQPLVFYVMLVFRVCLGNPVWAGHATVCALLTAGGTASFCLWGGARDRALGWFGAGLFLLTPYVWVEWLVRGDLSELAATCVLPWCLVLLERLATLTRQRRATVGATLGLTTAGAALILAHPITALLAAPALLFAGLAACWRGGRLQGGVAARLGVAVTAAVLCTAPFWQPLLTLRRAVNLEAAFHGAYVATDHTVRWSQLLGGAWGFGYSNPEGKVDTMSFELGALPLAAALTGVIVARRRPGSRALFAAYALAVVGMTPTATWLWRLHPFAEMQFPWRLLSVTAGLQVALGAAWVEHAPAARARLGPYRWPLVLLTLSLASVRPERFADRAWSPRAAAEVRERAAAAPRVLDPLAATDEFRPRTASHPRRPLGNAPLVRVGPGATAEPLPDHDWHHVHYTVRSSGPTTATLHQFYFPGWKVSIDGLPVPDDELLARRSPEGLLRVALAPGSHDLRAHYGAPPGGALRLTAVLCGAALLTALGLVEARARRRRSSITSGRS